MIRELAVYSSWQSTFPPQNYSPPLPKKPVSVPEKSPKYKTAPFPQNQPTFLTKRQYSKHKKSPAASPGILSDKSRLLLYNRLSESISDVQSTARAGGFIYSTSVTGLPNTAMPPWQNPRIITTIFIEAT
jgi:hypothetical protein